MFCHYKVSFDRACAGARVFLIELTFSERDRERTDSELTSAM